MINFDINNFFLILVKGERFTINLKNHKPNFMNVISPTIHLLLPSVTHRNFIDILA